MCAINPKRKHKFTLSVYTVLDITDEEWKELIHRKALESEVNLNADTRLRWHLEEETP